MDTAKRVSELERANRDLEAANRELWRTNVGLARERVGAMDSAAASALRRIEILEERLERMQRSLSWRLTAPLRWPPAIARYVWRRVKRPLRALALRILG